MSTVATMTTAELFERAGVPVYTDKHFVYTSEEHGTGYANLRPLKEPENGEILNELSFRLIMAALEKVPFDGYHPVVVVGPETLGALIAKKGVRQYSRRVSLRRPMRSGVFIHDPNNKEKFLWGDDGGLSLIKPSPKEEAAKVIWVDDLMNKGSTWRRTRHLLLDMVPDCVIAVATIANRSNETAESLGVPDFVRLIDIPLQSFPAKDCPSCMAQVPIVTSLGHGKTFQERNPDYRGGFVEL